MVHKNKKTHRTKQKHDSNDIKMHESEIEWHQAMKDVSFLTLPTSHQWVKEVLFSFVLLLLHLSWSSIPTVVMTQSFNHQSSHSCHENRYNLSSPASKWCWNLQRPSWPEFLQVAEMEEMSQRHWENLSRSCSAGLVQHAATARQRLKKNTGVGVWNQGKWNKNVYPPKSWFLTRKSKF